MASTIVCNEVELAKTRIGKLSCQEARIDSTILTQQNSLRRLTLENLAGVVYRMEKDGDGEGGVNISKLGRDRS